MGTKWATGVGACSLLRIGCLFSIFNHVSTDRTDYTVASLSLDQIHPLSTCITPYKTCNNTAYTDGISHSSLCNGIAENELANDLIIYVTFMYKTRLPEENKSHTSTEEIQVYNPNTIRKHVEVVKALSHVILERLHSTVLNKSWPSLEYPLLHLRSTVELISNSSLNIGKKEYQFAIQDVFGILGELSLHVSSGICEMTSLIENHTEVQKIRSRTQWIISEIKALEELLLGSIIVRRLPTDPQFRVKTNETEITISTLFHESHTAGATITGFKQHVIDGFMVPKAVLYQHGGTVTAKIKTSKHNPYTWDNTGCAADPLIKSLELLDANNANIVVNDTKEAIVILFPRDEANNRISKYNVFKLIRSVDVPVKKAAMSVWFSTSNKIFCYEIYLDRQQTLQNDTINYILYELSNAHDALSKLKLQGYHKNRPEIDTRYLLSSHGVELEEIACPKHAEKKEPLGKRAVFIESHSCLFWDKSEDAWKHDGCWVSQASRPDATVCMCNHLTTFSVVFVPVNTIDFQHVFSQDLSQNAMVFSFVVVLLSIYILLVAFMRRSDRDDVLKWAAHPMADNKEGNSYYYTLSVYTGHAKGSTCRSTVAFDLIGDDGNTEGRLLQDTKNFLKLNQGSLNHYLMSVPGSLGHLRHLTIWHDNTGEASHASWYLYWIVVCDLQTNHRYAFPCSSWLALDHDDGKIIRNLKVGGEADSKGVQTDFFRILRETLSDDNLWMSLLNRPTPSNFNRVQRLSVCLALAFLYMLANAMFYKDDDTEVEDQPVNILGLFKLNLKAVYIATVSSLIMIPANLLVVTIFRKAQHRKGPTKNNDLTDMTEVFHEISPKKSKGFPWWTIYIGWFILFCAVTLSAFFVISYSLQWGKEKAEDWFISMLTSFLESILLMEPLKALIAAAVVVISVKLAKKSADFSDVDPDCLIKIEVEGKKTPHMNIPLDDGPRIRPPDDRYIASVKKKWSKAANTQEIVHMIFSHMFFILITLTIIVLYRDYYTFWTTKAIDDMMLKNKPYYRLIKTPDEFYNWASTVAIPHIFPTHDYDWSYMKKNSRQFMNGGASFRVGVVRLRQLRVRRDTCKMAKDIELIARECNEHFNKKAEDTGHYREGWMGLVAEPCNYTIENKNFCPWKFRPSPNPTTSALFGHSGITYDSGGYVAELGTRAKTALDIIDYLKDKWWLDRYTRMVTLEWVVYNANLNHFSYCSYYVEFPETNGAYPGHETHTFRLYDYSSDTELIAVIVTFLHILYIMWLIHTCFEEFENMRKAGKSYIRSIDNCAEVAVIITSFAGVIVYMIRKMAVVGLKEALEDAEYVQPIFQNVAFLDKVYSFVMSTVGFMGMVKVNLLLAFDYRFTQMTRTLKKASIPIFYFTIVFSIVFFGFVALNYITMGRDTTDYRSLVATAESLMTTLLGKFRFSNFERGSGREFGMAIFSFYCIVQGFILLTMFMSIIIDAFSEVKRYDDTLKDALILEQVCWEEAVRLIENNLPDELQIWKKKGSAANKNCLLMESALSPNNIKIKDSPPDKYDLDWRIKKIEDTLRSLDGAIQKLSNKVDELENMDDPARENHIGQNKL